MADAERTADELEVLQAIFPPDAPDSTISVDLSAYAPAPTPAAVSGVLAIGVALPPPAPPSAPPLTLDVSLPGTYPSALGPTLLSLAAPWLEPAEAADAKAALEAIAADNAGEVVLHEWIESLRELAATMCPLALVRLEQAGGRSCGAGGGGPGGGEGGVDAAGPMGPMVEIVHSDSRRKNKSKFVAHAARVRSDADVEQMIGLLMAETRIAKATHNIVAYRYRPDGRPLAEGRDDDGEHGAGDQLLRQLQMLGSVNVAVVVTRWYGGIHLGPERFRIINAIARDLLIDCGWVDPDHVAPNDSDDDADASSAAPSSASSAEPVKRRLRPSWDVYNRIKHDPALNSEEYEIGYIDRFTGIQRIPYDEFTVEDVYAYEGVPFHRVVSFWHVHPETGVRSLLWDRETRVDNMFDGSS